MTVQMGADVTRTELRRLDIAERALTSAEGVKLEANRYHLELLARYLPEGVRTYAEAIATDRALYGRPQRRGFDDMGGRYETALVHPERAQRYITMFLLRPGEPPASVAGLHYALAFMGQEHGSVHQNPVFFASGEHRARPYRHRGWWMLSYEAARRIMERRFVPVLTAMPGRRKASSDEMASHALSQQRLVLPDRRATRSQLDTVALVRLLHDYLHANEPTCLLVEAERDERPLLRSRQGRPRDVGAGPGMPQVHTDDLLVHPAALAAHAARSAQRLGLPTQGWDTQMGAQVLGRIAMAYPREVERMARFSTVDSRERRAHGSLWFRVDRRWAQVAAPDFAELAAQWREHLEMLREAERDRERKRAEREAAMFEEFGADLV